MKLAHLADLHLGFRAFDRTNPRGANQREADVADALRRAITAVIAAQPDVVLLAGDLFHTVRPTNYAIITMFSELQRLRAGVPRARIVAIAGDHDSPRVSETGYILPLYKALGLDLALGEPAVFPLGEGWAATAVPKWAVTKLPEIRPQDGVRNVLLVHGEARQVPGQQMDPEQLGAWDYCALGHWHVCQQVGARAWYAGALEYATTDIWKERRVEQELRLAGKGWLLVELGGAEPVVAFQPVATRRVIDLEPLDALTMAPTEIDAAIATRAQDVDDALARLVIENLSRSTQAALDHTAIRRLKARALNLHIDARRPEAEKPQARLIARMEECAGGCGRAVPEDELLCVTCSGNEAPLPDVDEDFDALAAQLQQYVAAGEVPDPYQ